MLGEKSPPPSSGLGDCFPQSRKQLAFGKWSVGIATLVLKMIPNFEKLDAVRQIESRELTRTSHRYQTLLRLSLKQRLVFRFRAC
jgi:hypothetical protein